MILEDRFNTFCTFHKPEDKIKILFSYVRKTSFESSVEYTRIYILEKMETRRMSVKKRGNRW